MTQLRGSTRSNKALFPTVKVGGVRKVALLPRGEEKEGYDQCPACKRFIRVRQDGLLSSHKKRRGSDYRCPGFLADR